MPVITLAHDTSARKPFAWCFEIKVANTGGKPLDRKFELLTANMYAARGHRLRDDWLGADRRKRGYATRLVEFGRAADACPSGVLRESRHPPMSLQAIALRHHQESEGGQSGERSERK